MANKAKLKLSIDGRLFLSASVKTKLEAGSPLDKAEKAYLLSLVESDSAGARSLADKAESLRGKIGSIRFGTEAFKELLLIQCDRLAMVESIESQDKILDTLFSALKAKAPDPPPAQATAGDVTIGGKVHQPTGRFADIEV